MAYRWGTTFDWMNEFPGVFTGATGNISFSSGLLHCIAGFGAECLVELDSQPVWILNSHISVGGEVATPGFQATLFQFVDDTTRQCSLQAIGNGTGTFKFAFFRDQSGGTQIGASSQPFTCGVEYDIELKVTVAASGSAELRINGISVLTVTGDFTQTANDTANKIIVSGNAVGAGTNNYYKHLTICDGTGSDHNDFVGPILGTTRRPTAAGNYTDFTPNTGSNWDAVNDTFEDGDTTYNAGNVIGNKDSFVIEDAAATATDVFAVSQWSVAKRDDATLRGFKNMLRIGSNDFFGSEFFTGTTYIYYGTHWGQSPDTSSDWGVSEFNGTESGYTVTT